MKIGTRIQIFNYRMRERRVELGLTQIELAEIAEMHQTFISEVELIKPLKATAETRRKLSRIALALDCDFDYLFPKEYIDTLEEPKFNWLRGTIFVKDISLDQLPEGAMPKQLLPSVENEVFTTIMEEEVDKLLDSKCLRANEVRVLKLRYGLRGEDFHTLEMCAKRLGVSRERVRQIESTALTRLRHPKYRRKVRDFM